MALDSTECQPASSEGWPEPSGRPAVPTYAYACSACDHAFDVQQSFSDDALTVCPQCEKESLRKVFSAVGVVFKGSGFYRTDSRANATSGRSSSGRSPSSSGSASDGTPSSGGSSSSAGGGSSSGGSTSTGANPAATPA